MYDPYIYGIVNILVLFHYFIFALFPILYETV